ANGNPIAPGAVPKPFAPALLSSGSYLSSPLDSRTERCQWHRVVVHGALPAGTRVRVETFCADEPYDRDQLDGFATWAVREIAAGASDESEGRADCLVASAPGRYLWLRLTLLGNGLATPVVQALEIEFPRLTSLRYLPAVFAAEPTSADFTARFLALFDATLRNVERTVDTEARLFDPRSTPAARVGGAPVDFLTWLASWIGVRFDRSWSEAKRRQFLEHAGALLDRRGTLRGLREQLLILLGWHPPRACRNAQPRRVCGCRPLNCAPPPPEPRYTPPPLVLEHFRLRRWLLLGSARLGAQAVLWGSRIVNRSQLGANAKAGHTQLTMTPDPLHDPFRFHANRYTVFVPACYGRDDAARKALENLLRAETPAPARWNVEYVEPRMRIGVQSMIGFDAVVADLPEGARLGHLKLGNATLIAGAPAPAIRIGRRGRIGTGARLR
ncbi:MAG TPA: phage tail protein, partial [Usitatibacter sp.]|nr:phage tail protein [Usitatibacter sp.]